VEKEDAEVQRKETADHSEKQRNRFKTKLLLYIIMNNNLLEIMLLNRPYSLEEDESEETDISGENMSEMDSSGSFYPRNNARSFFERLANNINQPLIDVEPEFKKVLTETGEEKLKIIKYKDSQKKNISCPILFTDFEDDEDVIELECLHCFDVDSIKKWLKEESAVCPVCRHELKDIREEKIEKPPISIEEINRSIEEHINTVINNENDLYIQRLLLEEYEY